MLNQYFIGKYQGRFIIILQEFLEKCIVSHVNKPTDWLNNIVIILKS